MKMWTMKMMNAHGWTCRRWIYVFLGIGFIASACLTGHAQSKENKNGAAPNILINQLGYLPSQPKIALVSSSLGLPFHVIDHPTGTPQLKGMLELSRAGDPCAGANLWKADFSIVQATGLYRLVVPGKGMSDPFAVHSWLYSSIAPMSLNSFYFQRSGMALEKKYARDWARPAYHLNDAAVFGASPAVALSATGGWYDGPDYGKYTVSGCFAAGVLLSLYECHPDWFEDSSLVIPERNNQIPDILDEVKWELDWLFSMQGQSGGVHHKITALEPSIPSLPNEKEPPRFLMPVSVTATADFCALLAKAARIYEPYDPHFATRCLQASVKAWDYLSTVAEPVAYENPDGVATKSYSDIDDFEERFWAATELFITTGQQDYHDYLKRLSEQRVPLSPSSGYWGNPMPLAAGAMICNATAMMDSDVAQELFNDIRSLADSIKQQSETGGLLISLDAEAFGWGSNDLALQNAIIMILAGQLDQRNAYTAAIFEHWHYLLGRNPLGMVFITGVNNRSPQNIYHPVYASDKADKPAPGLLVGGPNVHLNDSILKKTFPAEISPALAYIDHAESYACNETSIAWNASLSFVAAWAAHQ